jgi:CheY-like chemotaxis protein
VSSHEVMMSASASFDTGPSFGFGSGSQGTPAWFVGSSQPPTPPFNFNWDTTRERSKRHYRILIADDHEAVRRGLRSALVGAGWQVCGEAVNGQEAIQKTMQLNPDLVILDVSMPNIGGLDAAREILKSSPQTRVLVFTMHESKQIRDETANIGVHGIAVKSAPLSTLLATIDSIFAK